MKVNDLRSVLSTQAVLIFIDNTIQKFWTVATSEDNDYTFEKDENINMWDIYGECEISQMYADDDGFNIELI